MIRRAAIHAWGVEDETAYVYEDLAVDDNQHARFDDVRSAAIALAAIQSAGVDRWLGGCLSSLDNRAAHRDTIVRGMEELGQFLSYRGVT